MIDPPWSQEAEQAVLGAMMLSAEATSRCMSILDSEEDFYPDAHQKIYRAMRKLWDNSTEVDLVTVSNTLRQSGDLADVGGGKYLEALHHLVPTAKHGPRYARIVAEDGLKRQLAHIMERGATEAYSAEEIGELIDEIADRVFTLRASSEAGKQTTHLRSWTENYYDEQLAVMKKPRGVYGARLGIPSLDRIVGGFGDQEMVLFKAQAKYGKTRLLRHSALSTVSQGQPVLFYTLEGNAFRWWQGCVSWLANVPGKLLGAGGENEASESQLERIHAAMADISKLPLYVSTELRTVREIQADILAQWTAMEPKPAAAYIDYLQLIAHPGAKGRTEEIKAALAMFLAVNAYTGMPIVTASQENREAGTFYSSEAEHAPSLVWQIEKGPAGRQKREEMSARDLRASPELRLINTHVRYGPMIKTREIKAEWPTGRFYDVEDRY